MTNLLELVHLLTLDAAELCKLDCQPLYATSIFALCVHDVVAYTLAMRALPSLYVSSCA